MTHEKLSESIYDRLLDNSKPLKTRLVTIPEMITGRSGPLDINKPPMKRLFADIKERRDAFVHCEPGEEVGRGGFVKEERFHDVPPEVIEAAVSLTAEVIRIVWSHVFQSKSGAPSWLPDFKPAQADSVRGLRLVAPT